MAHRIFEARDWYNLYEARILDHEDHQYLWRNPAEKPKAFQERLRRASYTNWIAKVVDTYIGYVFYNKAKGDIDVITEWNIKEIAKSIGTHTLIGGIAYVLVLQKGPRVYRINQITWEKRAGVRKVKIEGFNAEINIDFIKKTIEVNQDGNIEREENFDPDRFFWIKWNETGRSLIKGIDHLAVQIFNFSSVLDYHIFVSMTWWGVGPADMDKMPPAYSLIKIEGGGGAAGEFKIVTPDTAGQITIIRQEIDKRIMQMGRIVGLEAEFAEELKFESGISKAYSLIDTNAIIQNLAFAIMWGANRAGKEWQKLNPGRPIPTIELDPLLRPDKDEMILNRLKDLANFVGTPLVVKEAQRQAAKLVLSTIPPERMKAILEEIEKSEGLLRDPFTMTQF